jgi:hypothetical protein
MFKRVALIALPAVAAALVLAPIALDRPFASQSPRLIEAVYALRRWSPPATALLAAAMVLVAAGSWRRTRGGWRIALISALGVTIAAAWFARQNVFEWMFHPLARPSFVAAGAASFVDRQDLVLAVRVGADAAAYPIRQMAYHHLVNDRIGGTPAVVTY